MVNSANATGQTHEAGGKEVSHPDAEPRLPPGQAVDDHRRRDHPGVLRHAADYHALISSDSVTGKITHDVQRVGDPERDEIQPGPLPVLGFNCRILKDPRGYSLFRIG